MNALQRSVLAFQWLKSYRFTISIEDGTTVNLRFKPENYHHLIGAHHLDDLPNISNAFPRRFFSDVRAGKVTEDFLKKSQKYPFIHERIAYFDKIVDMLQSGSGKLIVEFDNSRIDSLIRARYFLFERHGLPSDTEFLYCNLFIGYNGEHNTYYPATYIVEHSASYMKDQIILNCSISSSNLTKKPVDLYCGPTAER